MLRIRLHALPEDNADAVAECAPIPLPHCLVPRPRGLIQPATPTGPAALYPQPGTSRAPTDAERAVVTPSSPLPSPAVGALVADIARWVGPSIEGLMKHYAAMPYGEGKASREKYQRELQAWTAEPEQSNEWDDRKDASSSGPRVARGG